MPNVQNIKWFLASLLQKSGCNKSYDKFPFNFTKCGVNRFQQWIFCGRCTRSFSPVYIHNKILLDDLTRSTSVEIQIMKFVHITLCVDNMPSWKLFSKISCFKWILIIDCMYFQINLIRCYRLFIFIIYW